MSKINKTGSSQDKAGSVVRPASVRKFPLRVVKREHMNPDVYKRQAIHAKEIEGNSHV